MWIKEGTTPGSKDAEAAAAERLARRNGVTNTGLTLGPSIVVKGHISGHEDVVIAGRVEGTIDVRDAAVTIAAGAHIAAPISAKTAIVMGEVAGDVTATEKVEVRERGSVEGTIAAPRFVLFDGGRVCGKVEMKGRDKVA
jgi:cytoskeletal protein CcmA (bactofilin family)